MKYRVDRSQFKRHLWYYLFSLTASAVTHSSSKTCALYCVTEEFQTFPLLKNQEFSFSSPTIS